MTNLRKLSGIVAIAAIFIAATGCKKGDEDVSTAFTITGDSSYHFEYGQQKLVSYTTKRITKIEAETPDGWTCVRSAGDKVFAITAPSRNAVDAGDADVSGTVKLTATTEAGGTLTREITVGVKLATEITAPANSFIVSTPDTRYKFNPYRRGNETDEKLRTASVGGGAFRLWSTSRTALVNVSFENDFIYFATGEADGETSLVEANAVVALTDKDNNILWSWHIWVTDFDPAASPDIVGTFAVMNRNLGAFANSFDTPENLARSYGLYYQWGRKDPFVGPGAWNSSVTRTIYNSAGSAANYGYVVSTATTGTIEYAVTHPADFIAGAVDSDNKPVNDFDWLFSGHDTGLWNADTKSVYDPCPAGWRVAPPAVWASFTTDGTATDDPAKFNVEGDATVVFDNTDSDETNDWYGWRFRNGTGASIFYPAAGRRSFSPTLAAPTKNYTNIVNDGTGKGLPVGFYWSSRFPALTAGTGNPSERSGSLVFRSNYVNPAYSPGDDAEHSPSGGFPLRCVARLSAASNAKTE